jgi:metallo-beta-lactamase class B
MHKFLWLAAAATVTAAFAAPQGDHAAALPAKSDRAAWNAPRAPFRIIGNVHYVGTKGLSAYLITDPRGHVLIDGGLPESAPLIAANIRALGFRLRDVRYILINHAHMDHSGGLAELKRLTGATLIASAGDRADLESGRVAGRPEIDVAPPVKVDRIAGEGDIVQVGDTRLIAHMTPGHTRGCTSWTTRTANRNVLFACSLTVAGEDLIDDPTYPAAASDFRATFMKLRAMKADIFLSFHGEQFDLDAKRARQQRGDATAFVDPGETRRRTAAAEAAFNRELARQRAERRKTKAVRQ